MTLSFRTIGLYAGIALAATSTHLALRFLFPLPFLRLLCALSLILAYACADLRHRLNSKDKKFYYIPLCSVLLVLGEFAGAIVEWHAGGNEEVRVLVARRCVTHFSLAWTVIAEMEWRRSGFHPSKDPCHFLPPAFKAAFTIARPGEGVWHTMAFVSLITSQLCMYTTVALFMCLITSKAVYQGLVPGVGPQSLFFACPEVSRQEWPSMVLWFLVDFGLCNPFLVVARKIVGVVENLVLEYEDGAEEGPWKEEEYDVENLLNKRYSESSSRSD